MEATIKLFVFMALGVLTDIAVVVFSLLFMHYSAKHRNHKLSVSWYVCGVFFGFWTLIVFLFKRKDFPGYETKVCYQCGDRFFERFEICPRCLIALPENNPEEKQKQKKLSRIFGIAFIISCILSWVVAVIGVEMELSGEFTVYNDRIAVDGVFYDKMGISYEDEDSVLLYDEDGRTYTFVVESYVDDNGWDNEDYYYVRDDGEKYFAFDCYITEEGWFYYDKTGVLEIYSVDTSTMTEEELDTYYNEMLDTNNYEYRYYDHPFVDAEGNFYYEAYEASWNEKGELITAENDVSTVK